MISALGNQDRWWYRIILPLVFMVDFKLGQLYSGCKVVQMTMPIVGNLNHDGITTVGSIFTFIIIIFVVDKILSALNLCEIGH